MKKHTVLSLVLFLTMYGVSAHSDSFGALRERVFDYIKYPTLSDKQVAHLYHEYVRLNDTEKVAAKELAARVLKLSLDQLEAAGQKYFAENLQPRALVAHDELVGTQHPLIKSYNDILVLSKAFVFDNDIQQVFDLPMLFDNETYQKAEEKLLYNFERLQTNKNVDVVFDLPKDVELLGLIDVATQIRRSIVAHLGIKTSLGWFSFATAEDARMKWILQQVTLIDDALNNNPDIPNFKQKFLSFSRGYVAASIAIDFSDEIINRMKQNEQELIAYTRKNMFKYFLMYLHVVANVHVVSEHTL